MKIVSKPNRNDPCPCGSGKKFKKCCGHSNVIAFNPASYNHELEQLGNELFEFAATHYESELTTFVKTYIKNNLEECKPEELDLYMSSISAWIILNKSVENGQTIFDSFYLKQRSKIKHARTRKVFQSWRDSKAAVFEVLSIDDQAERKVTIQDINTYETHTYIYEEADVQIGNLLIGIFVPFVQKNDFFPAVLEIPKEEKELVYELLDEFENVELNEVFPEFLAEVINSSNNSGLQWTNYHHEIVARLFMRHMENKGFDDKLIQAGILLWNVYCQRNDPLIHKPESYAAAIDYFIQRTFIKDQPPTQTQIAKEYGISPGTVSTNYRRLAYELDDLDIEHLLEEPLENSHDHPAIGSPSSGSFNMEQDMRAIEKLLSEQEFESKEELDEFLSNILQNGELPSTPRTPRDIAQDILSEAIHKQGQEQIDLIEQALEIYPNSPDAYGLLAEHEQDHRKRHYLLRKAIDVGEKDLGPDFFKENKGHFWGIVETRPYMRAKASYAISLDQMGFIEEAIKQYEELLELNPSDNQGIRGLLITLYIETELFDKASQLLEEYKDDITATFMFSKALVSYRTEGMDGQAYELLKKAHEQNPYVLNYLLKRKNIPSQIFGYITLGDENEAISYAQANIHLWENTEELLNKIK